MKKDFPYRPLRPLHSDRDHAAAVREIEQLWDAKAGTPAHDRLEILGTLVDAYEAQRWPIDLPDPVEAIRFHMEQRGLTRIRDLAPQAPADLGDGVEAPSSLGHSGRESSSALQARGLNRR